MLGINCLIKNTPLHAIVKDAVNTLGDMYVSAGKIPTVKDIWQELRANGIEVDVSTVGHIYMTELSGKSEEFYQPKEVEEQSSRSFQKSINKIINKKGKELKIGEESPVEMVANAISQLYKALTPNTNTKSVQRDLQDILLKGMRRLLPATSQNKNSTNFDTVVNESLVNTQKGFTDINGSLNSMRDMHLALKRELANYTKELAKSDPFEAAKFTDYVNEIMNSSYQLMFSKSEANTVVTDALKSFEDGRFVKVTETTNSNGVVTRKETLDWKEISKYAKDVTDVANMVQSAFESKLDKNGNRSYSDEEIDIIKQSVAKEYQNLYQKNVVNKITQGKKTTVPIKNEWQKARDLVNKIADKFIPGATKKPSNYLNKNKIDEKKINEAKKDLDERYNKGELTPNEYRQASELLYNIKNGDAVFMTTQQANSFISGALRNIFGNQKVAQSYRDGNKSFIDLVNDFKASLGEMNYSKDEQNVIANSVMPDLENYFQKTAFEANKVLESKSKERATPQQREDFERLAELQSLGAFSSGKFNPLIYKSLGVSELPIKSMQQIEAVTETINKLLKNVKSPVQAQLLFKQLTSDINIILHNNITRSENKISNVALRTIHHFNLYTQAALNGILMNIFNMVQNVTANTMQMISTSANVMTNADVRYLTKNVKLFWSALTDVGFRNGLVDGLQAGEFSNEARLDDYLRKPFKELFTNKSVGDKFLGIWKAVLMPFRVLGSAYDAAAKSVNTKKLFTLALNDVLKAKGYDNDARYKMISDALYDGKLLSESIEEANKLIELIGDKPNKDRAYRMAQNIMAYKLVDSGTVSEAEFNSIANTAFKVSGKGLGHEYQYELKETDGLNAIGQVVTLPGRVADLINSATAIWKAREMGDSDKTGYAIASLVDNVKTSIFTKFIGGSTRWIPLVGQSAGLGLGAVSQLGKKIDLVNENGIVKNTTDLSADIEKKLTKNEAFFRGLTGIAFHFTLGLLIKEMLSTDCPDGDKKCEEEKDSAKNYIKSKISTKVDPAGNLILIAKDLFDEEEVVFDKDSWKYISQTLNIDNKFDTYGQIKNIAQNSGLIPMSNVNQKPDKQQAMGGLGKLIGGTYTNPINAYAKAYEVVTKGRPKFEQQTNIKYGLFGGGILERIGALPMLGIKNDGITGMNGVGGAKVDRLKDVYGITTKQQLKDYLKSNGIEQGLKKLKIEVDKKDGTKYEKGMFNANEKQDIKEWMDQK